MTTQPCRYRALELPRAYRRVLWWAACLVPRLRRPSWRREWEAELTYAYSRATATGRGTHHLFARALWAHIDALWVWKEEFTMRRALADLRLALRSLRRSPMFAAAAILTLALGIGTNTAIFSVVNAVLLKPLPFPESDRLVMVLYEAPGIGLPMVPFSEASYVFVRDNQRAFESLGMHTQELVNIVGEGDPEQVGGARITPSVLSALRVSPAIGRPFTDADAAPGAEPVALLAHELWGRRYGSDESIVGENLELDGVMRRIVGIMPEGFAYPSEDTRVWRPYELDPADLEAGSFSAPGIARLAPGATLESAYNEQADLVARLSEALPDTFTPETLAQSRFGPLLKPLKEIIVGDIRRPLWVVLGTVGLVVLIACANVANLFLVRAESRRREVTLRAALGARGIDVARFFLTESLLLSLGGGIVGLGVALAAVRGFSAATPVSIPRVNDISVDTAVLAFTLVVSLLAGLLFGCVPLLRSRSGDIAARLREGSRGTTAGTRMLGVRNVLVVAQVALALVLLVGSGLMVRSFRALRNIHPGFESSDVLTVRLAPPGAEYPEEEQMALFWESVLGRIEAVPGVISVSATSHLPLSGNISAGSLEIEDHPTDDDAIPPLADKRSVPPNLFATLRIPVLEGRDLSHTDGADRFRAVVVSESFARHWWPGETAIGKRIAEDEDEVWYQIVGVVGDVRHESLEKPTAETAYFPLRSGPIDEPSLPGGMDLVVRTAGDPELLATAVREAVWEVDPRLPIANMQPLGRLVSESMSRTSFTLVMLGIASLVALLLGAIGIYGVIAYIVSERTQEIGVRIALGSSRRGVQAMVVRRGLALAAVGIAIGLGAAVAVSSVLTSLLYEVDATDPITYTGVVAALGLVALIASWLPAMRASSVDPVVALRAD